MLLYFDLDSKQLINGPGFSGIVKSLSFVRGDHETLEVRFLRADAAVTDVTNIVFVIKEIPGTESPALAIANTWENPEGEEYFTSTLSLNTEALDTLLGESRSKSLLAEITCHQGGTGPITSQLVTATVTGDLWRGDETTPEELPTPDAEWLAHGHAQTLTAAQKTQARENIGLEVLTRTTAEGPPPPAGVDSFDFSTAGEVPELEAVYQYIGTTTGGRKVYAPDGWGPTIVDGKITGDGPAWQYGLFESGPDVAWWLSSFVTGMSPRILMVSTDDSVSPADVASWNFTGSPFENSFADVVLFDTSSYFIGLEARVGDEPGPFAWYRWDGFAWPSIDIPEPQNLTASKSVANAAARLALTLEEAQGFCIVEADTGKSYMLAAGETDPSAAENWLQVGDRDISISDVSGLQTALDGKATAAQGAKADTALQSGDHVTIPDLKAFRWLKKDGVTVSNAAIYMWEDHDANGGELIMDSPWRIALIPRGPCQLGPNDAARYPRYWMLSSGYASGAQAALEYMPSGVLGWQTSVWNGSSSVRSTLLSQAKHLDTTGTNTVLEFFENGSVGGENGGGGIYNAATGVATGTKICEIYRDGVWSNGTAPAPAVLVDGATVTLTCSKYKTHQNHTLTLGGNRTLAISGAVAGMRGTILVEQDSAGSRTLTLPTNAGYQTGFALSTAAYAADRVDWFYDGSYFWFEVAKDFNLPLDADAAAFLTAASITSTSTEGRAVNKLTLQLKNASLWSKIYALYPFVGGNATAHRKDLKGAYNGTFSGTPTHNANGITGNGTDAVFNSGLAPSAVSAQNSLLVYAYCRTQSPTTGRYIIGATGSDSSRVGVIVNSAANIGLAGLNSNTIQGTYTVESDYRKHIGAYRDKSTTTGLLVGKSKVASQSFASLSACNQAIAFLARNPQTGFDNFSDVNLAMGVIAQDLSGSEYSTFCGLVDNFQQALGRKNP